MNNPSLESYYHAMNGRYVEPAKIDPPMYKGFMVYTQKTGGFINIVKDPNQFAEIKDDVARISNQSVLRKKAPNGGRLL
jgi:hypothetical protein